jgi:hypothetical protein
MVVVLGREVVVGPRVVVGRRVVVVLGPAVVVVVGPLVVVVLGPAVVVVIGPAVVVVVGGLVLFAEAACINASMLKSTMANETIIGPMKAPVPIKRFSVARFASSTPSKAELRSGLFSSMRGT